MAKLIKSILANRMMFRGGGLVPPSQAAGILASSSPLIDSVTLNEGGLVNYARGGIALGARPAGLKQSDVPTTYLDIAGVDGELPGNLQNVPFEEVIRSVEGYQDSAFNKVFSKVHEIVTAAKAQGVSAVDAIVEAFNVAPAVAQDMINQALSAGAGLVDRGEDLLSSVTDLASDVSVAEQVNGTSPVPSPAGDMIPGGPPEASWTGYDSPDVSVAEQVNGTSPMTAVAAAPQSLVEDDWRDRPALVPAGYTAEAAKLDALRRFAEGERHRNVMTEEGATLGTELPPVLKGWAGHGPSGSMRPELGDLPRTVSQVAQDKLAEITAGGGIPGETLAEELLQSDERMKMRCLELVRSADRRYGEGLSQNIRPPYADLESLSTDDAVSGPEITETEAVDSTTDTDTETTTTSDSDTTSAVNSAGLLLSNDPYMNREKTDNVGEALFRDLASDENEEALDSEKLAAFKQEFIDSMPEWEGKTSEEKGLDWMRLGAAMMAGKSPHALVNIGEALKEHADIVGEDAKEQRAFKRQIDLSAAKYGIQALTAERTQRNADARKTHMFYDTSKATKENPYGEVRFISQAEIMASGGVMPEGLRSENFVLAAQKQATEQAKAIRAAIETQRKEGLIGYQEAKDLKLQLKTATKDLISAEVGTTAMSSVIELLATRPDDIIGISGAAKTLMGNALKAIGFKDISTQFTSRDEAKAAIKLGLQKLIPVSLGEAQTANSISNRDVELLADAYLDAAWTSNKGGGVFDLALITANKEVMVDRLQQTLSVFSKQADEAEREYLSVLTRLEGASYSKRREALELSPYIPEIEAAMQRRSGVKKRGGSSYTFKFDPKTETMRLYGAQGTHFQDQFFSPTLENLRLAETPFKKSTGS